MNSSGTAPTPTIPEVFDHLVAEGNVPALRRTSGIYEFDIEDGGGQWFLALDEGTPKLHDRVEQPNCVVGCSAADFLDITQGRANLVTAFLQGRIKASGDAAFMLEFRRLVPVPA